MSEFCLGWWSHDRSPPGCDRALREGVLWRNFEECGCVVPQWRLRRCTGDWHDSVGVDIAKLKRWMKDCESAAQRMQSP